MKPPALTGREAETDAFGVALTRLGSGRPARSFVLDGLRGIGKTVLLNEFETIAKEEGWFTSGVLECNEDDRVADLLARLAYRALNRLSRKHKATDAVKRAFGVLRGFVWTLGDSGTWRLTFDVEAIKGVADSGDTEADIVELLVAIGRAGQASDSGALFLLDELQFLPPEDLRLLAAAWHQISQQEVPVMLAAAGLPHLPVMLKGAVGYTERLFDFRSIDSLPRAAAAAALTIPAARGDVSFSEDALSAILDAAAGYPYFLQQWGEAVWNEADGTPLDLDDVEAAEILVNDELDRRFFRDRYELASAAERIYISSMADLGDGPHTSAEIAGHMGKTANSQSVARANLIKKGLIYTRPQSQELEFTLPNFAAYTRRVHPFDPQESAPRGRPRRARR